jgi:putative ABC transport system ATP-binding protein
MGPSGSGKTTLLNLIGGLDQPTRGEIVVDGQRIDRMSSTELSRWRARHVGFVFQFYNLLPVLTARAQCGTAAAADQHGRRRALKRANLALEIVGLKDRARHKPKELSGGQEQRVAIARALVSDPTLWSATSPPATWTARPPTRS